MPMSPAASWVFLQASKAVTLQDSRTDIDQVTIRNTTKRGWQQEVLLPNGTTNKVPFVDVDSGISRVVIQLA